MFTQAVAQVSIAADRGDTLPILTGVRVEIEGDKMTLLATDRYRLAMRELHLEPRGHRRQPRRAGPRPHAVRDRQRARRQRLHRRRPRHAPPVATGLVGFEAGQRRTTTRLLDGEYPKVTSIFPTSVETESVIKTSDLVEAVKRVALVAERNTPVRLRFSEGQVAIEAGTGDDAQASEAVEAVAHRPRDRDRLQPALPARRPRRRRHRALRGSRSPSPRARPCSPDRPRQDGEADTSYRYVLMPVRFAS